MSDKTGSNAIELPPRRGRRPEASKSPPGEVLRRKTRTDAPSIAADTAAEKDLAAQASLMAAGWRDGVDAVIERSSAAGSAANQGSLLGNEQ